MTRKKSFTSKPILPVRQTLSLCMIVRNEEEMLAECLASVRDVVDEMLILDTGSTDGTIELARSFGAVVHESAWEDDFAKARNASIQYAKSDWILWLDADERLLPESIPQLKKLLKPVKKPTLYNVHIRNIKEDGCTFSLSKAHRLFSNNIGLQFSGRIHEQLVPSAIKLKGVEFESKIILLHLGYGFTGDRKARKARRNLELLQQLVTEDPGNAYAHYKLGEQYNLLDQPAEALEHLKVALSRENFTPGMKASLFNVTAETYLRLGEPDRARKMTDASLALVPHQTSAIYLRYRLAEQAGELSGALGWLDKLLTLREARSSLNQNISVDVSIDSGQILYTKGMLLLKMEEPARARAALEAARNLGIHHISARESLVDISLKTNDYSTAETELEALLTEAPDEIKYLNLLAILKVKQQDFPRAIQLYEQMFIADPGNRLALKRLVGLYSKVGEVEKAHRLLQELNRESPSSAESSKGA
ncbi:MAG: tetratricopeptide repeat protein [Candidatus Marinimicrobia bacterium]|nr:tetratricopeptide repeat protein [Candidatus Neomarinimicrobiota bacterium]MCF7841121.1 tetratricopeptide repeat protein [Candidatus Neomarinimicrobiota bacterium]MCF7901789.1 tetratricopeptide repeat protein [Candidatus Neomarinimicrobiota bacterium]